MLREAARGGILATGLALPIAAAPAGAQSPAPYGQNDAGTDPEPACADQNTWTVAGAISLPSFPFQNRPTFQQVVTLTRKLPR
jgi:hypothetical protein